MIKIKNDLTGKTFNYLTVTELDVDRTEKVGISYWVCKCKCGNIKTIRGSSLSNGDIKSCGCLVKEYEDLSNKKFNYLTVIKLDIDRINRGKKRYWICKCDCGNTKSVRSDSLIDGSIKSCGCLKISQDKVNLGTSTHQLSETRQYKIWSHMKDRCYNKNSQKYRVYGGRGIKVCNEWMDDFMSFYNWSINNGYSDELSIDRIDVNGNYEPSNCRWITLAEQGRNKQNTLYYTIEGITKPFREWCDIYSVNYKKAHDRFKKCGIKDPNKIFFKGNLNDI